MAESSANESRKRKMKSMDRSRLNTRTNFSDFDSTTFPQILAASFNIQNPSSRSFIIHFLHSLLDSNSLRTMPHSFLSLLPLLMNSKYDTVSSLSLEVIGAAALSSMDMNINIASDDLVIQGLVWALGRKSKRRLSWTACNALMDVTTSAFGRDKLREANAVEKLLNIQYLLNEGDILYIPRGFLHEACTITDAKDFEGTADFSLHLTFGIEVEAPFEWEGFTHIALHCWNEKQKRTIINKTDSKSRIRNSMLIIVLHIAIRLVANDNPTLRKACMVAAYLLSADAHMSKHKGMFQYIIDEINANANFMEAFKCIKMYIEVENDNSLQWLRWLRHLPQDGYEDEKIDFNDIFEVSKDLVMMFNDHTEEAVVEFSNMKSVFCRYASFEDAYKCYLILLEKYRKVRKQYMNGMLSLHSRRC